MIIYAVDPWTLRSHAGQHQRVKHILMVLPPRRWFWREAQWLRAATKRLQRRGRRRVQSWTWGTSWSQRLTGEEWNDLLDMRGYAPNELRR